MQFSQPAGGVQDEYGLQDGLTKMNKSIWSKTQSVTILNWYKNQSVTLLKLVKESACRKTESVKRFCMLNKIQSIIRLSLQWY